MHGRRFRQRRRPSPQNVKLEFERNGERYAFLRWGQNAFDNFRVVPPGTGICHQVNLEYLAQVVWTTDEGGKTIAYPDTLVGTDSHTTMVNGLAVLGWGVGGIEAEAAMLGQPISMLIPEVVGFRAHRQAARRRDRDRSRAHRRRRCCASSGVVGRFVEFYGPGIAELALADRATIGNMAPEYGATCGFFPIDAETIRYLTLTGRDPARVTLVEAYAKAQGLWRDEKTPDPVFTDTLELDLVDRRAVARRAAPAAGPRRARRRRAESFDAELPKLAPNGKSAKRARCRSTGANYELQDGDVVIAAITCCTNTSNPERHARRRPARDATRSKRGLKVKPWVKTSLAPGSQVVTDYLRRGRACRTISTSSASTSSAMAARPASAIPGRCPSRSPRRSTKAISSSPRVLSGNRNFEGRIHPQVRGELSRLAAARRRLCAGRHR